MRTAEYEDMIKGWDARVLEDADERLVLRQENHILTESLDRSKDAIAAVIEQREKLAAKLREAKR